MARSPFVSVDPLAEVLHLVRITGTFYCRSELRAPWGLFMPPMEGCMWFHAVSEGRCLVELEGEEPLELGAGGFLLVPHGKGHRLRSARRVAAPNVVDLPQELVSDRYSLLRYGGDGPRTTLVCGIVRLEPPTGAELERVLPALVHLDAANVPHAAWMDDTLRLMAEETRALRPGGETVVTRLSDVLVIQTIRAWLDRDPLARTGWLGGLRDPQIGRALSAVWRSPREPWTVPGLAAAAGMSRSAFSARFTELLGEPPMQHVTRVRMQVASASLRNDRATVAALAGELGYQSEAAFSRAFKRMIGTSPGAVRRSARSEAASRRP